MNCNNRGKLFIKEFPPKSITTSHIKTYVEKLSRKRGFKPDVIVVDYINLLQASTPTGSSYTDIKAISEKLRALSYHFACPMVTATQLNRDAFNKVAPGMENTSESIGLSMTADAQFAIWSDEDDKEMGHIHMACQKNRFGLNHGRETFRIDYDTLSIENMTENFANSDHVGEAADILKKLKK